MDDSTQNDTRDRAEAARDLQPDRLASLERVIGDLFRAANLPEDEQRTAIADLVTVIECNPDLASSMHAAVGDLMASPCEAVEDQLLAIAESSNLDSGTLLDLDNDLRSHIQSCPTCWALLEDLEGPVDDFTTSWGERASAATARTLDRYFQTRRMLYRTSPREGEIADLVPEGQHRASGREPVPALMGLTGTTPEMTTDRDGGTYRRLLADKDGIFTLIEFRTWLPEAEAFAIELGLLDFVTGKPLTAHHTEWAVSASLDGRPLTILPSSLNVNEWTLADPISAESRLKIAYFVRLLEPLSDS